MSMERMDRVHADRVIRWISAAALVVSAALSATGCGQDKPSASEAPTRPPAMVTVAVATSRQMPIYLDRIGKMVAMDSVTIVPQVGGKIIGVHFEDGASVKKGDLLFQIDPRPFQAVLDATQAELAQNKAQLDLARDELKRYGDAVASSAVSEMEFKQKTNAAAIAEARVAAGQAATETAKLNLEFASIYSPIDGRAGARLVDPGNVVTGNLSQLLVIQRLDPIYAEFTVNENDLGAIRSRLPVLLLSSTISPLLASAREETHE